MRGYEAIANALAREGVEHVFAVPSNDNMDMLIELKDSNGVGVVSARKECGATGMADGYSRVTGKPGICTVTVGPGLTNAATALVTASRHRSPVICITTEQSPFIRHVPKGGLDQRRFAETTAGKYICVGHPETLAEDIRTAFRHVRSGQGPVVLAVPREIMKNELDLEWEYAPVEAEFPAWQRAHPEPLLIARAAEMLSKAERPFVLAGRGAAESQAGDEMQALAERTGALLGTTLQGKGYFSDHPYSIGVAGPFATESVHALLSEADCVVAVGSSLNAYTTEFGLLFAEAKIIQIDRNPSQIGKTTPVALGIVGDARASVAALNGELAKRRFVKKAGFWNDEVKSVLAASRSAGQPTYEEAPGTIDPNQLMDEVEKILPKDRIVVLDAGFSLAFPAGSISVPDPSHFVWTADFLSVGMGLFAGVGAAVGRPDKHVVVFTGDGGFMMTLEELDTAVRHRIPMTVIVMNDNAFGAEVYFLRAKGRPEDIARYDNPDFAEVARSLGAVGLTVRKVEDLQAVAAAIGEGDRPVLVDAKVNGEVFHEVWQELHPIQKP